MYPLALKCGVTCDAFWQLSAREISDVIAADNRRVKDMACRDYNHAMLVYVAFNDPKHFPRSVAEAFPHLFAEELQEKSWRDYKESVGIYAEKHNREVVDK